MTTISWDRSEVLVTRNRGAECLRWIGQRLSYGPFPMIAARVVWQIWPNVVTCAVFWVLTARWLVTTFVAAPSDKADPVSGDTGEVGVFAYIGFVGFIGMGLGLLANAVVTLVNGGLMPVSKPGDEGMSIWVAATDAHHLRFLGDNYAGFSLGDLVALGGVVLLTTFIALDRRKQPAEKPKVRSRSHVWGLGPWRGLAAFFSIVAAVNVWADTWVFAGLVLMLVLHVSTLMYEWHLKDVWGEL